jgi:hypothetical protein
MDVLFLANYRAVVDPKNYWEATMRPKLLQSRIASLLLIGCLVSKPVFAEYCWSETVTSVILQGGTIYFTTNKTCPSWCAVDPAWSGDQRKEAYAMLMAARLAEKPLTFFWAEHGTSCAGTLPVSSKPQAIIL